MAQRVGQDKRSIHVAMADEDLLGDALLLEVQQRPNMSVMALETTISHIMPVGRDSWQ